MVPQLDYRAARLFDLLFGLSALFGLLLGCHKSQGTDTTRKVAIDPTSSRVVTNAAPSTTTLEPKVDQQPAPLFSASPTNDSSHQNPKQPDGQQLSDLLPPASHSVPAVAQPDLTTRNMSLIQAAGIRTLTGQHIVIYTDLAADPEIAQLPHLFDQAVELWTQYFSLDRRTTDQWKVVGHLISDKQKFVSTGLLPQNLPPFLHGYQHDHQLWIYDQPSDYYRRHLLLHEGTHAFMRHFLGSAGPPWYMEGMAEILGTHRWEGDRLTIGYMPRNRKEVPYWGRVKIVRDQVKQSQAKRLSTIMSQKPDAFLHVDAYGWSWAAAAFLDGHPRYRDRFRELHPLVENPQFTQIVRDRFAEDWDELTEEWQLFVMNMDYGYDLEREAIVFSGGKPLEKIKSPVTIRSDQGWQSTGVWLEANDEYTVTATGRYVVTAKPTPWWCEPNGITIRYHQGKPLGILLYAIRPDNRQSAMTALARPREIGSQRSITPQSAGTLFLRINDSPAELADNAGILTVHITRGEKNSKRDNSSEL